MTGNGEHTTYQNADFSGGWFFMTLLYPQKNHWCHYWTIRSSKCKVPIHTPEAIHTRVPYPQGPNPYPFEEIEIF